MSNTQPGGLGGLPSGLHVALNNLGRTRGSSATPAIESPAPSRSLQQEISNLSNREYSPPSSNAFGFQPQPNMNFQNFPSFGGNPAMAWQVQQMNTMMSNNYQHSFPHQQAPCPPKGHGPSSSASASILVPPTGFYAPSTTRQGVTKNLSATAPLPSSATFPSFNQRQQGSSSMSSQAPPGSQGSFHAIHDIASSDINRRLHELQKRISSTTSHPRHVQEQMKSDIRHTVQQYNEFQRAMMQEFDRVSSERKSFKEQLLEMNNELRDMIQLREKAVLHGDGLRRRISDIGMHHRLSKERLIEMNQTWAESNQLLRRELAEKKKALTKCKDELSAACSRQSNQESCSDGNLYKTPPGERSLQSGVPSRLSSLHAPPVWPSNPPNSPISPSKNPSSKQRINQHPPAGPIANNATQRPNLPSSRGPSAGALTLFNQQNFSDRPRITTETGTNSSMALVHVGDNLEQQFQVFEEKLTRLFSLMEAWVENYANIPNPENDRAVAQTNAALWDYMLGLTHCAQQTEAHKHTTTLLNSRRDRRHFIMRMMTEYVVKDILNVLAFRPASEKTKQTIDCVKGKLEKERGMTKERRQELLDEQLYAVREIVEGPGYRKYRSEQLEHHGKKLRKMLGGLLNHDVVRASAGTDLGAIATFAWDLSAKMNTTHFTFVTVFFETTSRFNAATMTTKDAPNRDPMQLQLSAARLKLVITPNITIRDDRGVSIKVKNLHKSSVLVQC